MECFVWNVCSTVELGTHVTVSPTASTASSDGGDKAPPFPVPSPSHASVETGSTHVKLWPAESTALSAGTPVVIVFKLRLVAKEESPATRELVIRCAIAC